MEYRTRQIEFRAKEEDGAMIAEGVAILYDEETVLYSFGDVEERETIGRGAAAESLANDDWRALWNHDRGIVLGRMSSGTLRAEDTDAGVKVSIEFPDTEEGRSKFSSIKRGDVSQMSFAFEPLETREERIVDGEKTIYRTEQSKIKVYEVSPVTFPAYENTTISARAEQRRKQIETEASAQAQRATAHAERAAQLRELLMESMRGEES